MQDRLELAKAKMEAASRVAIVLHQCAEDRRYLISLSWHTGSDYLRELSKVWTARADQATEDVKKASGNPRYFLDL